MRGVSTCLGLGTVLGQIGSCVAIGVRSCVRTAARTVARTAAICGYCSVGLPIYTNPSGRLLIYTNPSP
jgi:hypothetical protein